MSKITKNSNCIKAYYFADPNTRKKVRLRLNNYLKDSSITLSVLGKQLQELLKIPYERKRASALLRILNYPKKDKNLVQQQRIKSEAKTFNNQRQEYCKQVFQKYLENGGSKYKFKNEIKTISYGEFNRKYKLTQYGVDAISELLKVKKNNKLMYTYQDLYNDLKEKGYDSDKIRDLYINQLKSQGDLMILFEKILNRKIGEKRIYKLMKMLNLKHSEEDFKKLQGRKSRREKNGYLNRLNRSGYTLQSLANKYENDHSLTKRAILKELNSKVNDGESKFTDRWLGRHLDPLLSKTRLGCVSREELEFRNTLHTRYPKLKMETSNRTLIAPQELDIYFPEKKTAIEFNGDFWHSDKYMLPNHGISAEDYHRQKLTACEQLGITLLFVWESDWTDSTDEVLRSLDNYMTTGHISKLLTQLDKDSSKFADLNIMEKTFISRYNTCEKGYNRTHGNHS